MEFIIWDPTKSTKTDADILLSLEWPDSAGCTGVRYKVIEAEGQKVLIAGEYDGQIHIYNVGGMKKSKTLSDNSVEQMKATRVRNTMAIMGIHTNLCLIDVISSNVIRAYSRCLLFS
jgi:tricorn protease-like protein